MNENPSIASIHPVIRNFVLSIIQTIKTQNYKPQEKPVIDTDLIPKISEKTMRLSMEIKSSIPKRKPIIPAVLKRIPIRHPTLKPRPLQFAPQIRAPVIARQEPQRQPQIPKDQGPPTTYEEDAYEKITPLLNDPSVSTIECTREGAELMIVRMGQRQKTRIVLSSDDIEKILDKIAEETHIPLMEGVFRASVKGFSINAIISKTIGSRFVIKKTTPYGLLE